MERVLRKNSRVPDHSYFSRDPESPRAARAKSLAAWSEGEMACLLETKSHALGTRVINYGSTLNVSRENLSSRSMEPCSSPKSGRRGESTKLASRLGRPGSLFSPEFWWFPWPSHFWSSGTLISFLCLFFLWWKHLFLSPDRFLAKMNAARCQKDAICRDLVIRKIEGFSGSFFLFSSVNVEVSCCQISRCLNFSSIPSCFLSDLMPMDGFRRGWRSRNNLSRFEISDLGLSSFRFTVCKRANPAQMLC